MKHAIPHIDFYKFDLYLTQATNLPEHLEPFLLISLYLNASMRG